VPIVDIKANPKNPRTIRDDAFQKLVKSIREFPAMLELRPLVLNADGVVLGGNMRLRACQAAGLTEVPVVFASALTEEQQREFIIKDNVGFGEWEWEVLASEWDVSQLAEWGLEVPDAIDTMDDGEEIEIEQSVQLEPPREYIIVMAEPNSMEWEEIKERLKLRMVRRGGYKEGSPFDAMGLERVIKWADFKERYDVDSNTK
jgi:ParB-like chromosome segregation protein Spo0J